ncbi:MAG: hypothetical protein H7X88_08735 [Gloeobacteraceae cyanobacterium ES-bin-316]|nr:hypothetical protein [Ferruginibacter sp.]
MQAPIAATATPDNTTGKFVDAEHFVVEETIETAIVTYNRACTRLLNPPVWQQLTPGIDVTFKIAAQGKEAAHKLAEEGDYFMIDIPGPGPAAGQGYDWVKVETIEENTVPDTDDSLAMRLRAAANPNNPGEGVAHFFNQEATSTFIIKRKGTKVTFSYHGRNEISNTGEVKLVDKIRNGVVALGAESGLSEVYWSKLVKGMLQKELGG